MTQVNPHDTSAVGVAGSSVCAAGDDGSVRRLALRLRRLTSVSSAVGLVVAGLVAGVGTAQAQEFKLKGHQAYASLGTQGFGVGYATMLTSSLGLRAAWASGSTSGNTDVDGIHYDGKLQLRSWSLLGDVYLAGTGFRLSGGVVSNGGKFNGTATQTNAPSIVIGGTSYNNVGLAADGRISDRAFDPYVGFGWSSRPDGRSGLGLSIDLGVQQMAPQIGLKVTQGVVLPADLERERQKLQDKVNDQIRLYPVLSVGLTYTF